MRSHESDLVGHRYIATDNKGAIEALCGKGYPVPDGVIYVTVEKDYPEHRKVQVRPDGLWLTYEQLGRWFRLTGGPLCGPHSVDTPNADRERENERLRDKLAAINTIAGRYLTRGPIGFSWEEQNEALGISLQELSAIRRHADPDALREERP